LADPIVEPQTSRNSINSTEERIEGINWEPLERSTPPFGCWVGHANGVSAKSVKSPEACAQHLNLKLFKQKCRIKNLPYPRLGFPEKIQPENLNFTDEINEEFGCCRGTLAKANDKYAECTRCEELYHHKCLKFTFMRSRDYIEDVAEELITFVCPRCKVEIVYQKSCKAMVLHPNPTPEIPPAQPVAIQQNMHLLQNFQIQMAENLVAMKNREDAMQARQEEFDKNQLCFQNNLSKMLAFQKTWAQRLVVSEQKTKNNESKIQIMDEKMEDIQEKLEKLEKNAAGNTTICSVKVALMNEGLAHRRAQWVANWCKNDLQKLVGKRKALRKESGIGTATIKKVQQAMKKNGLKF